MTGNVAIWMLFLPILRASCRSSSVFHSKSLLKLNTKLSRGLRQQTPASSSPARKRYTRQQVYSSAAALSKPRFPSLIVFDLDNTLWTPELYQLRRFQRGNTIPVAHRDVKLFPAIHSILQSIRDDVDKKGKSSLFANTKFAVASRTSSIEWAHDLLQQFQLYDFFDYIEIFPADKKQHFANLKSKSGIEYHDMLFFDDARDGKYGNCEPVSDLGVLAVHCPNGIYEQNIWNRALHVYSDWYKEKPAATIIEWDGTVNTRQRKALYPSARYSGTIQMINREKKFGFIRYGDRSTKDLFFHFSSLPVGVFLEIGDEVSFSVTHDNRKGKDAASEVALKKMNDVDGDTVDMKVFSMNLPFAALLANGYKTLETRNGTMFTPYKEGTKMLLHVGQRIYPDGDRHVDVMRSGGLDDDEILELKSLPHGYGKGMAVAIVEIGKTYATTLEERCDPEFQRRVAAFGEDSGVRATEIRRVEYLEKGVRISGRGGVFKASVDKSIIPSGWLD